MSTHKLPTFEEVQNSIKETLEELEAIRVKGEAKNQKALIAIVIAVLAGVILSVITFAISNMLGGFVIFAAAIVIIYSISRYDIGFKEKVKYRLVLAILRCFDEELNYFPDNHISKQVMSQAKILRLWFADELSGEDYVEGYFKGNYVRFSRVKIQRSSGENHIRTIFDGAYSVFEFNKEFKGHTVVLRDVLEKSLGFLGQKIQDTFSFGKLVKLEHADFENRFAVYADDQIEARYILSTTMMEKLIELDDASYDGVLCGFVNNEIHLAVGGSGQLFKFSSGKTLHREEYIYQFYETIYQFFKMREFLGLDQKLWTKQN